MPAPTPGDERQMLVCELVVHVPRKTGLPTRLAVMSTQKLESTPWEAFVASKRLLPSRLHWNSWDVGYSVLLLLTGQGRKTSAWLLACGVAAAVRAVLPATRHMPSGASGDRSELISL